ncbi:hypothetical protein J5X84_01155 [Streptosporangiaceae bacterium NEAU-GS5]|nr:hypothetical protein [Streptosporangiaceae bacterium NEAU-GS5]
MRTIQPVLAALVTAALLTACGGAGGDTEVGATPNLSIITPENGDRVNEPFTLRFKSNVPIGPPASGKDHVHVFADGRESDYTVVTTTSFVVKDLPVGTHRIGVTLEHADHSPAGATDEITVQIDKVGVTSPPDDTDPGGGY